MSSGINNRVVNTFTNYVSKPLGAGATHLGAGLSYLDSKADSVAAAVLDGVGFRVSPRHGCVAGGTGAQFFRGSLLAYSLVNRLVPKPGPSAQVSMVSASPSQMGRVCSAVSTVLKFLPLRDLSDQASRLMGGLSDVLAGADFATKAEGALTSLNSTSRLGWSSDRLSGAAKDLGAVDVTLTGRFSKLSPLLGILGATGMVISGLDLYRAWKFSGEMDEILERLDAVEAEACHYSRESVIEVLRAFEERDAAFLKKRFRVATDFKEDFQFAREALEQGANPNLQADTEELFQQLRGRVKVGMIQKSLAGVAQLCGAIGAESNYFFPVNPLGGVMVTAAMSFALLSTLLGLYSASFEPARLKPE